MKSLTYRVAFLLAIIAAGILSRVVHTGWTVFDKYMGDALYAAMVYWLVRLFRRAASRVRCAAVAMGIMTALELFQLTIIPAGLAASPYWSLHVLGQLLGTQFSFLDLLAYAVGIAVIAVADRP